MASEATPVLEATGVSRSYGIIGASRVTAVDRVDLTIGAPGLYAIVGRSGSGKSTLLHLLAGLDKPTTGAVRFRGIDLAILSERRLAALRRQGFGFVFQRFHLIPTLSGRENITLPITLAGGTIDRAYVAELTNWLGLDAAMLRRRPDQLSGGQQQRVAVARALVHKPDIVFADEPTGNLDTESAIATVRLLRQLVDDFQARIVLVTHDLSIADTADTLFVLQDGQVQSPAPDRSTRRAKHLEVDTVDGLGW